MWAKAAGAGLIATLLAGVGVWVAWSPSDAVVVENRDPRPLTVAVTGTATDETMLVIAIGVRPGQRVTLLGGNGAWPMVSLSRIEILDTSCSTIASVDASAFGNGGALVRVEDGKVAVTAGGNPRLGDAAASSEACSLDGA